MVNYMKITKIDYLFFGIAGILFIVVIEVVNESSSVLLSAYPESLPVCSLTALQGILRR